MIRFIALTAIALATVSCDKHSWKETQVLHEKYSSHGAAAHGESHGAAKDSHGTKAETHGEAKPAAHGAEKPKH